MGADLHFSEGLVLRDQGDRLTVLYSDGTVEAFRAEDVEVGEAIPGVEQALSPAGQLLLASGSPTFAALRGERQLLERLLRDIVADDPQAQRLLAIDSLRTRGGVSILEWLDLADTEKTWLRSLYHADLGDWSSCFAELSQLPEDRYPERIQLYLQGRDALKSLGNYREPVRASLLQQSDEWMHLLSQWLGESESINLSQVSAAAHGSTRVSLLVRSMDTEASIRNFADVSPAARVLDAITSPEPWPVGPADLKGRNLTYIDELIDRGQLSVRDIPDYRAVLDATSAAYVAARLDPRQLSDDEVDQFGPSSEAERRALLRGVIKSSSVADSPGLRQVALVEQALKGSHEALAQLRQSLPARDLGLLEDACQSISCGEFPSDEVLADRTLWPALERELGSARIAAASSRESSEVSRAFIAWATLRSAKAELHDWRWEAARDRAQAALLSSTDEPTSDEALNLIAAAQTQLGNHSVAFKALEKALEGEYNSALQSNAVSVATHANPEEATALLARLVAQAPDLDARLAAAQRGIRLWRDSQGDATFPDDFLRSLRKVAVEPIALDDFTVIAEVLATQDTSWFRNTSNLRGSPHQNAPRTQIIRARELDYPQSIRLLAKFLRSAGTGQDPWLRNERDMAVRMVIQAMHEKQDAIGYAGIAYEMLDAGMPMETSERHEMNLLAARENCFVIDPDEAFLRDDRVDAAINSWRFTRGASGPDSDRLRAVGDVCMNVVARHLTTFHRNALVSAGLTDYERMYGPEAVLVEKMQTQVFWANEWLSRVRTLRPTVTDLEALEFLDLIAQVAAGVLREEWV